MAKRRNEEVLGDEDRQPKRRKQSLISADNTNPLSGDGLSQCFREVPVHMYVYIAPAFASAAVEGIQRQHLDPLVLQYHKSAKGVVISYSNVRLLGQDRHGSAAPLAKVQNESPFSYMWIAVDLLVWSPRPGDVLEGWISVQSPSHIALLVHDTFNATIRSSDIPESWQFVPNEDDETGGRSLGYWQDAQGARIDGKLRFEVKYFNKSGRTVLVVGSLLTASDVSLPSITPAKDKKHMKFDDADTANGEAKKHKKFDDDLKAEDEGDGVVPYASASSSSSSSSSDSGSSSSDSSSSGSSSSDSSSSGSESSDSESSSGSSESESESVTK